MISWHIKRLLTLEAMFSEEFSMIKVQMAVTPVQAVRAPPVEHNNFL
jgi:hypothetical protein